MEDNGLYVIDDNECFVILPWAPSVNAYWNHGAKGMVYLSKRGREFKNEVKELFDGMEFRTMTGRLRVDIILEAPSIRKLDTDNFNKAIFDSLTNVGLWTDDSQVDLFTVCRGVKRKGGRVVVRVRQIDPEEGFPLERDNWIPNHWFYKNKEGDLK